MKEVYVGLVNGEAIAFHKKKKVVSKYLRNYKDTNPTDIVKLCKISKKDIDDYPLYNDYYLVSCRETYIQTKFEGVLWMETSDYENKTRLISQLEALLLKTKNQADRKVLIETIEIINVNKKRCGTYTPSLRYLQEQYWMLEQYRYHMNYC